MVVDHAVLLAQVIRVKMWPFLHFLLPDHDVRVDFGPLHFHLVVAVLLASFVLELKSGRLSLDLVVVSVTSHHLLRSPRRRGLLLAIFRLLVADFMESLGVNCDK